MLLLLSAEGSKGAPDPDPGEVAAMDELEPGRVPPAPHGLATAPPLLGLCSWRAAAVVDKEVHSELPMMGTPG